MSRRRYVLDTNILSAVLKKESQTVEAMARALVNDDELVLCPVVFYEIQRGLRSRDAQNQLSFFERYARALTWEDLDRGDWEDAAESWAQLRARGYQIEDADLLIGTYAARRNAVLVTDNVRHFESLDIPVENWRRG